jgi:hypothetical protein
VSQDDNQEMPRSADAKEARMSAPEVSGDTATTSTPRSDTPTTAPEPVIPVDTAAERDPDDTVGTGTSIALGCIAGTLLLIVIGLIFVGILAIF